MKDLRVLMVAEGSGGHLIPALQVAKALSQAGARVTVWYAARPQTAALATALLRDVVSSTIEVAPIPVLSWRDIFRQLWRCGALFSRSRRYIKTQRPDVVVGFGGFVSVPVLLVARRCRIRTLLHEQNVVMGQANRFLARYVDRVAVSFDATRQSLNGASAIVTGMPVRADIGQITRAEAVAHLGLDPDQATLLVLGGSQGSRAINHLMLQVAEQWSEDEPPTWQVVHVSGHADASLLEAAYARARVHALVKPFLADMAAAYAAADLVIGRAGASTIAELAQCKRASILIPYPYAGGHQCANGQLVGATFGGLVLPEWQVKPEHLVVFIRCFMEDPLWREGLAKRIGSLAAPEATDRLARAILDLAAGPR